MPDHFQGTNYVELQPGDINIPIKFIFTAASASTTNDGSMPYGSTVKSVVSSIKNDFGTDATTSLISSSAINENSIIVFLSYSSNIALGKYILTTTVKFALSGTTTIMTKEFDFSRVYLRNL